MHANPLTRTFARNSRRLAFGIAFLAGIANAQPDRTDIARALDREDHHAVLAHLEANHVVKSSDPALIRNYCRAFVQLNRTTDNCFESVGADEHVIAFGRALIAMWRGQIPAAREMFERLRSNQSSRWLGYQGLLEIATATTNYLELGSRLKQLKSEKGASPRAIVSESTYLGALLLMETGQIEQVGKAFATVSQNLYVSDPDWFRLRFRYLWANGNVRDLGALLDAANAKLGSGVQYQLSRAEYLGVTKGRSSGVASLRGSLAKYPHRADLLVELAYSLLDRKAEGRDEVRKLVQEALENKGNDLDFILNVAISLMSFQDLDLAAYPYRLLRSNEQFLIEYSAYYTLRAWDNVYAGQLDRAKRELSIALTRAPYDSGANWLAHLIAKKQSDYHVAFDALVRLFELDPFNENVVDELIDIGASTNRLRKSRVASRIRQNLDWFSDPLKRKILKEIPTN
jgi:hypothetical protein